MLYRANTVAKVRHPNLSAIAFYGYVRRIWQYRDESRRLYDLPVLGDFHELYS